MEKKVRSVLRNILRRDKQLSCTCLKVYKSLNGYLNHEKKCTFVKFRREQREKAHAERQLQQKRIRWEVESQIKGKLRSMMEKAANQENALDASISHIDEQMTSMNARITSMELRTSSNDARVSSIDETRDEMLRTTVAEEPQLVKREVKKRVRRFGYRKKYNNITKREPLKFQYRGDNICPGECEALEGFTPYRKIQGVNACKACCIKNEYYRRYRRILAIKKRKIE